MNQETAGLTNRPDCTAVLHLALRALTAPETTCPDHPTVRRDHLATHADPGRLIAHPTPDDAPTRGLHRDPDPSLAHHRPPQDVASTTGSARALHLARREAALATKGLAPRTTTIPARIRTLDGSRSTTRKRRTRVVVILDILLVQRQVALSRAKVPSQRETMVGSPVAMWIYPHAMSEAERHLTETQDT